MTKIVLVDLFSGIGGFVYGGTRKCLMLSISRISELNLKKKI